MISAISGKLLEKDAASVVVDVHGVGYEVTIPLSTFYLLGETGSDVSLRIYTYVREDTLQLFGFSSKAERGLFLKLIAVSGIGPKLAVSMLSGMSPEEIVSAIRSDDVAKLTSIPGVGKKTAERMVVELRDKMGDFAAEPAAKAATATGEDVESDAFEDALSALVNLGYRPKAAERELRKAVREGTEMTVQKLLKRSLQLLAGS
ncbi:MAG: Holliday junction branch migration protein RuvA [Acidobacteria bacterium]|nr:MAG: Holliday junction branch migration protein RuvA [Acidobacteriota bacterium]REK02322.1 MAG: Holliday junction branch migration protein RuvA [Acidobacteriota bacterium]REK13875.1 MAG: Holliday junction branch migration protein RuvA [Acidobacteriota bacterium]